MSKVINISYKWDKDTFLKASKLAYDYELKNSNRKYIGWFFIALTQFGVVAAMKKGAVGLLFISTFLVIYWYYFRWSLRKRFIERTFDKLPNANLEYKISVDKDSIMINDNSFSWSDIVEIVNLEDGFLIYLKDNFLFFPSWAFESLEEKSLFATYAKELANSYKKASS